jgi:cytidylate kinase
MYTSTGKTHETIDDRIAVLDNDGLAHLAHDLANRVSYYNAAEGDSYRQEAVERELAKTNFRKVVRALYDRGIKFDTKGYLL